MSFTEVSRNSRSFFSHPAANNARGRGGFLGVDSESMAINHVPFTVRGDTPVWGEFTPVLPSAIARIVGAPFDPVFVLEDGTEIRCSTTTPDGFAQGDAGLSMVYKIPVASLPSPRLDGKIELKRMEVTGGLRLHLQTELTTDEIAANAYRADDVLYSIAAYTPYQNNANYTDGTKTHAETGKAVQVRTPEVVFLSQGGLELGRAFIRWEIQHEDAKTFIVKVLDPAVTLIPQNTAFMETAATLGYTTIGGSTLGADQLWMTKNVATEDFTVDEIIFYHNNAIGGFNFVIYDNDGEPNNRLELVSDAATVGEKWETFAAASAAEITDTDTFFIGLNSVSSLLKYYDNIGVSGDSMRAGGSYNYPSTPGDPYAESVQNFSLIFSWYVSGTSGGGSIIPQIMHHRQLQRRR